MRKEHERNWQCVPDYVFLIRGEEGEEVNLNFQVTCVLFLERTVLGMGRRCCLKTLSLMWDSWFVSKMRSQQSAQGSQGWSR